jgi:hypothetical protein
MRFPGGDEFVRNRWLVLLLTSGILIASWGYAPHVDRGPVVCLMHGLVGLPCPACGLTHAFCDLMHGRLASAAAHNAVAFPLLLLFILAIPTAAAELLLGRRLTYYDFLYSSRLAYAAGAALIVYHVARSTIWFFDGRLYTDYFATSWLYRFWGP